MHRLLKQALRSFFTLNKGEQRAIVILLFLVLAITVVNQFLPYYFTVQQTDHSQFIADVESFRQRQQSIFDSIQIERMQSRGELSTELAEQKLKPFRFNPNDLPEDLWKQLGLTENQIRVIKNYEKKGGTFKSPEDLQKMYCISDAEYEILKPYIDIQSPYIAKHETPVEQKRKEIIRKVKKQPAYRLTEMNAADTASLAENLVLPLWLAARVIKYRELLGGFNNTNQLKEVYGFDSNRLAKLEKYIIFDLTLIRKININTGEFKEILHHPYISYEMTKAIVNSRQKEGEFKTTRELITRGITNEPLFIKLNPYLSTGTED